MSQKRTVHKQEEEYQQENQDEEEIEIEVEVEETDSDEEQSNKKDLQSDYEKPMYLQNYLPLYGYTDLSKWENLKYIIIMRFLQELLLTSSMMQPDEYWQGTEVAYDIVYGKVDLPWEWMS